MAERPVNCPPTRATCDDAGYLIFACISNTGLRRPHNEDNLLFFGEVPTLSVLLGMAAVLSAIVMVNLPSSNHEGAPNPLADDA